MSQLLNGRYQLIKVLGSDSVGKTYLVSDIFYSDRQYVIRHLKLPDRNPRTLQFVLTLLRKKTESLQKFSKYDRIPEILSYFEENNNFYLVEERIPGRSLAEELIPGHPLSEAQTIQLLQDILQILVVVHGWGIVHRCVNPSNLIRREVDGSLVLTGFGVFKEISTQTTRASYPSQVLSNGSAVYSPPDSQQGTVQFNSDLYAVGMIGIQAATGLTPKELTALISGNGTGTITSWQQRAALSPQFIAILEQMVHSDTKQRYQQATEVLDHLDRLMAGKGASGKLAPGKSSSGKLSTSRDGSGKLVPNVVAHPASAVVLPSSPARSNSNSTSGLKVSALILIVTLLVVVVGAGILRLPQSLLAYYFAQRGTQYNEQNDTQKAIANFTRSIQLYPTSDAYYSRGIAHNQQDDPRAALDDLNQALAIAPSSADIHYERGNIWFALGDRQKALADYTQAILLDPTSPNAYVNRGTVRAELGDEASAIEDYSRAIEIDPTLAAAYLNRCLSYSNMNNHQMAIADCTQAINLQPNSVRAYQNRGLVRRRLGDKTGAIEDFNIAIRLDPGDPDPYYNRGLTRYELGDRAGAIDDYTKAIRYDPNHVFAYYDRGIVQAEIGNQVGAIADFQQSAKLCLDSGRRGCYEDAQFQLKQLQSTSNLNPQQ